MQSFDYKKYLPTLLIIVGFAVISIVYCLPAYKDMVLNQGDITSWKGMSQEAKYWHEKTGENTLWSNSMFGGGPTYTYYIPEGNNLLSPIQVFIQGLFKKPAYFFFIAMLSFFIFASALRINKWLGVVGAVAFAFTSFSVISITAGHDTKILSMAYIPAVFGGLIMLYRGKYLGGGAVFALAFTFMMCNAHWQIVYYTGFCVLAFAIGFFIKALQDKTLMRFIMASAIAVVTTGLAAGTAAVTLLPTMELNKETMRGGVSDLTLNKSPQDQKKKGGLDRDYAFQWSASGGELFCMLVPYLYGGGDNEPISKAPETDAAFQQAGLQSAPLYWGPQPFLAGPMNYVGAVVCFLFVLGMIVIKNRMKWVMLGIAIVGILMSMGKHFPALNYFLFDRLPMFHSFRTPTMVHAIPAIIFPIVGIWGVSEILSKNADKAALWKAIKIAAGITAGLAVLLGVGAGMFLDFTSDRDKETLMRMVGNQADVMGKLLAALKKDRADIAMTSGLTSAVYILIATGLLWAYVKDKLTQPLILIAGLGILTVTDLVMVDKQYLNEESYVEKPAEEESDGQGILPESFHALHKSTDPAFAWRPAEQIMLQDTDKYYRVLDMTVDPYNNATQAYYHNVIGGYSPAKLERYQDLIDMQMGGAYSKGKFNSAVLAMLNTKYIVQGGQQQQQGAMAYRMPDNCGNAWFVEEVKWTRTADEDMLALNAQSLGDTVVMANGFNPKKTAVMRDTFKTELNGYNFGKDSTASIKLTKYGLNTLEFASDNSKDGLAVFSDIYYPHGWAATVDGKETPIMKADYVLRAIKIPAGKHKIVFNFHPQSYYTGNMLALICSLAIIALCIAALAMAIKNGNKPKELKYEDLQVKDVQVKK